MLPALDKALNRKRVGIKSNLPWKRPCLHGVCRLCDAATGAVWSLPRNPNLSQNCFWAGPWSKPFVDGGTTLLLGHLAGLACDRSRSQISVAITKSLLYCRATWTFRSPQKGVVQRPRIQEKENSSSKLGCFSRHESSVATSSLLSVADTQGLVRSNSQSLSPHRLHFCYPGCLIHTFTMPATEWRGLAASPLSQ